MKNTWLSAVRCEVTFDRVSRRAIPGRDEWKYLGLVQRAKGTETDTCQDHKKHRQYDLLHRSSISSFLVISIRVERVLHHAKKFLKLL